MITNKKGFTLTELIIAITVVGAIAALAVPSLLDNINRKILTVQIKNSIDMIQQVIDNQLTQDPKKTFSLENTQFSSPSTLLSSNFKVVDNCTTVSTCWPDKYKRLSDMGNVSPPSSQTRILKNGTTISYSISILGDEMADGDQCYGLFWIDINGKNKPNIVGRDFFAIRVTKKGKLVDGLYCSGKWNDTTEAQFVTYCKNNSYATACLTNIMRNNWKMNY